MLSASSHQTFRHRCHAAANLKATWSTSGRDTRLSATFVLEFDNIYSIFNLNAYVTNIPILCLLLDCIILDSSYAVQEMKVDNFAVGIACLVERMIVTAVGTLLNASVSFEIVLFWS